MNIAKRKIGTECPVFIIAELSANHNQDFDVAVATIKAAKDAGADAIKLQTYTPDTITIDCDNEYFQINQGTIWDGTTLYKLYEKAYTPWDWQPKLKEVAESVGLVCFSSPFDKTAVDFLEKMDVPAYKVASFEITDIPLIRYIAQKNKPVILSTGVAMKEDIDLAVQTIKEAGNNEIALLKCTSAYPTPLEEVNLRGMPEIEAIYQTVVGLSDHTLGIEMPVAATALGAKIIEKHFILDKDLGGPDAMFSLDPKEFKAMSQAVRNIEKSLGTRSFVLTNRAKKSREHSRSLFVTEDVNEGESLTESNIRSIRPGFGMHPKYWSDVLGRKAKYTLKKGQPLSWDMIKDE